MKKILCSAMDQGELTRIFTYAMDEAAFRAACAKQCAANAALPHIKTISAVGAYEATFGAADVDSDRLTKGLIYLTRSGVLIDPEFKVDVVNFLHGRNYFAESKPADLTFVSYVIAENMWAQLKGMGRSEPDYSQVYFSEERLKQIIPRIEARISENPSNKENILDDFFGGMMCAQHSSTAWKTRAVLANSKIIYTYGGYGETGTRHYFPEFIELIASSRHIKQKLDKIYTTIREVHGAELDVPLPWSGYAADPQYLLQMKDIFAAASTDLARAAVRAVSPPHGLAPAP